MSKTDMATLLLVDDHNLYREGLVRIINTWDDFELIGEASTGSEAVEFCRNQQPDLVLMDIQMPLMSGVEAAGIIHREFPEIAIVMLTVQSDRDSILSAIMNGASGYVLKDIHSRQLHDRLRGVIRGEGALSGSVASKVLAEFRQQRIAPHRDEDTSSLIQTLTERERNIVALVVKGSSNEAIAKQLFLSEAMVKKQLVGIMRKLNVENRVQLAVFAVRNGL